MTLRAKRYSDQEREQKIKEEISRLGELVESGKVDADRLDKALAGELPIAPTETPKD